MLFALHRMLIDWLTPTITGPVNGVDSVTIAPSNKVGNPGAASHVAEGVNKGKEI